MGYFFLLIALVCGLEKGYCQKKCAELIPSFKGAVFINVIRFIFCVVIALIVMLFRFGFSFPKVTQTEILFLFAAAVPLTAFSVSWFFLVKKESYMFVSVFTMLGAIFTSVCSSICYNERISFLQGFGMVLLLISVYVMSIYNQTLKGKLSVLEIVLLIVCGVSSGLSDFSQKVYRNEFSAGAENFNFYTYLFSMVILFVCYLFYHLKDRTPTNIKPHFKQTILYITLMSVGLFLNTYSKTIAAGILPAALMYPLLQGANLICSAAMSSILFKEKATLNSILGMLLAFIAILLINF